MYKRDKQQRIEDFVFPYGELNPENEWVKLVALVPWDAVEERYALQFENNGHLAHPAWVALGALIIKQRLKCGDEWTVRHVSENPYLQYFIGLKGYSDTCPFGAATMVAFWKRFSQEDIAAILEASIPQEAPKDDEDDDGDNSNGGTLIMDATCCPADIAYPQDKSCSMTPGRKQRRSLSGCARRTVLRCRGHIGGKRGRSTCLWSRAKSGKKRSCARASASSCNICAGTLGTL